MDDFLLCGNKQLLALKGKKTCVLINGLFSSLRVQAESLHILTFLLERY